MILPESVDQDLFTPSGRHCISESRLLSESEKKSNKSLLNKLKLLPEFNKLVPIAFNEKLDKLPVYEGVIIGDTSYLEESISHEIGKQIIIIPTIK